jgi:hypothetical protein
MDTLFDARVNATTGPLERVIGLLPDSNRRQYEILTGGTRRFCQGIPIEENHLGTRCVRLRALLQPKIRRPPPRSAPTLSESGQFDISRNGGRAGRTTLEPSLRSTFRATKRATKKVTQGIVFNIKT